MKTLLLILWLFTLSFYLPLNRRQGARYFPLPLDTHIPLIPVFAIPYILYLPYVFTGIILAWPDPLAIPLLLSLFVSTITATLFWYYFPTGVKRPHLTHPASPLTKFLLLIYRHDQDNNAIPSAHVYKTLIVSYFLIHLHPSLTEVWITIGGLITISTLFTKQHYLIDIITGIVWTFLSLMITNQLLVLSPFQS